jgi:effector-binding domain-containing protein
MTSEPRLEYRKEQPYAAIRAQVPFPIDGILPVLWEQVAIFLASRSRPACGAPFIRYLTTDMTRQLDIEVGFPVPAGTPGNGRVTVGMLPAGHYAVLVHSGPYEDLITATARLLEWAKKNRIAWKTDVKDDIEWWAGRVEWYPTNPAAEQDPGKWQTELAFLTAGI